MKKRLLGSVGMCLLAIAACVGDDPGGADPAAGTDAGTDGTTPGSEGGPGTLDGGGGADACASTCKSDDTMIDCAGQEVACALGCSPTTKACRTFDPAGPVTAADLALHAGELDVDLPATPEPVVVDTTNGSITSVLGGAPLRAANAAPGTREVVAGIGFERRGGVGIFTAKSFILRNTIVRGDIPVAFVATTELKVLGHVSTACGEAGGAAGAGPRPGNGGDGQSDGAGGTSGGGGGGHGTAGAKGGDSLGDDAAPLAGGPAGPVFTFDPANLRGGGRGGGGGNGPGAGGGVILVAAGAGVKIGDGVTVAYKPQTATFTVPKGIHVGGCGGSGGRINGALPQKAGSGGGAGGTIVIEAPKVLIDANSGLAANGGGGGGTNSDGANAQLTDVPASEGFAYPGACATSANGGKGAAGASAAQPGSPPTGCDEYSFGGGGGGGGGRIMIRNRPGNVNDRAPTSILSPTSVVEVQQLSAN